MSEIKTNHTNQTNQRKNANHPKMYIDHVYRKAKPIGYCHCRIHKGYLDTKLMKKHACLTKQCPFFQKYEHTYWDTRAKQRADKKRKKEEFKLRLELFTSSAGLAQ